MRKGREKADGTSAMGWWAPGSFPIAGAASRASPPSQWSPISPSPGGSLRMRPGESWPWHFRPRQAVSLLLSSWSWQFTHVNVQKPHDKHLINPTSTPREVSGTENWSEKACGSPGEGLKQGRGTSLVLPTSTVAGFGFDPRSGN